MAYKTWTMYALKPGNVGLYFYQTNPGTGEPSEEEYLIVRNAAAANQSIPTPPDYTPGLHLGQWDSYTPGNPVHIYHVFRTTLRFYNYLNIPVGAPIEYARIDIKPYYDWSDVDFDIVVQNGQPTYPHYPVVLADYFHENLNGNGGSLNTSGLVLDSWNNIFLNATGRGWLNVTEDLVAKLYLRSSRDISATKPLDNDHDERISFRNSSYNQPRLTIRVTLSIPTAVTYDATDIETDRARFNGEITNKGWWLGSYGFEWKEGEDGDVSSVTVGGEDQTVTTFNYLKTGLNAGTIYFFRAWGSNGAGKGYGNWVKLFTGVEIINVRAELNGVFARVLLYGEIVDLIGQTVVERGFEYKIQEAEPGSGDTGTEVKETKSAGFAIGEYSLKNKELYEQEESVIWWFRAYCKDAANKYTAEIWMKNLPTVTTQAVTNINYNKADGNGTIISKGASDLTRRGFEVKHEYYGSFSDSWKFEIAGFEGELKCEYVLNDLNIVIDIKWEGDLIKTVLETSGLEVGVYSITIGQMIIGWPLADDCLIEGETYKCKAFASNEFGTVYGEEVGFSTSPRAYLTNDPPIIGESSIIENEVLSNLPEGVIASRRGFRYGTTQAADEFDVHEDGSFTNESFNMMLPDLLPNTTYYITAYIVVNGIVYECETLKILTTDPVEDEYPTTHYSPRGQDYREISTKVFAEVLASQGIINFSGGKKTLPINNHLIQANSNAKIIADNYLDKFKLAKTRMEITFPTPLPFEREDTIDFSFGDLLFKENDQGIVHFKEDGEGVSVLMDQIMMIIKKINSVGLIKTGESIEYIAVLDLEHG